jgi:hypothetical protein
VLAVRDRYEPAVCRLDCCTALIYAMLCGSSVAMGEYVSARCYTQARVPTPERVVWPRCHAVGMPGSSGLKYAHTVAEVAKDVESSGPEAVHIPRWSAEAGRLADEPDLDLYSRRHSPDKSEPDLLLSIETAESLGQSSLPLAQQGGCLGLPWWSGSRLGRPG